MIGGLSECKTNFNIDNSSSCKSKLPDSIEGENFGLNVIEPQDKQMKVNFF